MLLLHSFLGQIFRLVTHQSCWINLSNTARCPRQEPRHLCGAFGRHTIWTEFWGIWGLQQLFVIHRFLCSCWINPFKYKHRLKEVQCHSLKRSAKILRIRGVSWHFTFQRTCKLKAINTTVFLSCDHCSRYMSSSRSPSGYLAYIAYVVFARPHTIRSPCLPTNDLQLNMNSWSGSSHSVIKVQVNTRHATSWRNTNACALGCTGNCCICFMDG